MVRQFSILLVEDDDPLRCSLSEVLQQQNWVVYSTPDGFEAIELARSIRLDFSILDLHLPGITGLEVLQSIHKEVRVALPSIMMSGQATPEETRAAIDQGVFTFLRKPLDLAKLRQTVDQLIDHHFGPGPYPG